MRKRGLRCRPVSVRLSVRPSVTFVYCIQTADDIVKLLSRPGSPIILVFWPPAPVPNSNGNPISGGAKYKGWEILWFSTEIAISISVSSDTVQDRPMVAIEHVEFHAVPRNLRFSTEFNACHWNDSRAVAHLAHHVLLRTLMQSMIWCSVRRVHQGHTKLPVRCYLLCFLAG